MANTGGIFLVNLKHENPTYSHCLYLAVGKTHACEFTFIPTRNGKHFDLKQVFSLYKCKLVKSCERASPVR